MSRTKAKDKNRKLVIVGDEMCGKTCLLQAFAYDTFDPNHTPTVFDTHAKSVKISDKISVSLALFDTAGQETYDRLRPISYNYTDVVLICFSVDHSVSANNVMQKWIPEIRHYCPSCPIILVACKIDLRTDNVRTNRPRRQNEQLLSTNEGKRLAGQVKANAYMECSAKSREGVQDLFIEAARLSLLKSSRRRNHFCEVW